MLAGFAFLLGWVVGFLCCWKMQIDYERIKKNAGL